MAATKLNARHYTLEINTGTSVSPTWVEVKGVNSLEVNLSSTEVDGSTFDSSDGWAEDYTVRRSATVTVSGRTLYDKVAGTYDAGQSAVNALGQLFSTDAVGDFRIVFPGGDFGLGFNATVSGTRPFGGGSDDLANFSAELKIQGAPTALTI